MSQVYSTDLTPSIQLSKPDWDRLPRFGVGACAGVRRAPRGCWPLAATVDGVGIEPTRLAIPAPSGAAVLQLLPGAVALGDGHRTYEEQLLLVERAACNSNGRLDGVGGDYPA